MKRILILLFILGILVISCAPTEEAIKLNASIKHDASSLYLTNNDSFDWIGVELGINQFEYTYSLSSLGAGKSVNIYLSEFVNSKGDRFNTSKKIMTLYIVSKSPSGACGFEIN